MYAKRETEAELPDLADERLFIDIVTERLGRIVERYRAEQALIQREWHLRTVLHTTVDGFLVVDAAWNISEVNEAYCRMSGYSRGELLGMRIIDLEADETPDELRKRIRRIIRAGCIVYANPKAEEVLGLKRSALRNRTYDQKEWKITGVNGGAYPREELPFNMVQARSKPVYDVRHAIEWPDTSRRILSIDAAPLQDDRGDFDGMIATLIDITRQGQVFRITIREYILDLLNGIFSTLSRQKVELESDIEDLQVPPRVVIPLGLIINETATNAIKHGFAEEEPAHFYVSLNSKASNGAVVLELWNSGREFPADIDPLQAESQGLLLITSLADHLRGTLQLTRTPSPRFTLRFPLEPFKEESANNG